MLLHFLRNGMGVDGCVGVKMLRCVWSKVSSLNTSNAFAKESLPRTAGKIAPVSGNCGFMRSPPFPQAWHGMADRDISKYLSK